MQSYRGGVNLRRYEGVVRRYLIEIMNRREESLRAV